MKISVKIHEGSLKILINNLPHIFIKHDDLICFHAYYNPGNMYMIKYYTKTSVIVTEFGNRKTWSSILKQLNQTIYFM